MSRRMDEVNAAGERTDDAEASSSLEGKVVLVGRRKKGRRPRGPPKRLSE